MSDSREQVNCITLIVSTCERMQSLGEENHEAVRWVNDTPLNYNNMPRLFFII